MPATVSYISVGADTAIPIRIFINRRKILLQNSVAVNEKSTIKLAAINLIRLSNYDLNNLIEDIGPSLREILLTARLAELFPKRAILKTTKLVKDISHNWKCKVNVSLGYIVSLRYNLGRLDLAEDVQFLSEKNVLINPLGLAKSALLRKEMKFSMLGLEEEDELGFHLDDKKSVGYKLRRVNLMNNHIVDTLDVYVVHRPKI